MEGTEQSGVITIGEMEYAVGMFWQTAEDPKTVKREAKLAAKQEAIPADLFVMREGFVAQWAIGWTSYGHKKDMPAAAACLSEVLTGNWLAVFRVDGGWWFAASRRDAILPDGDILYDNEDEPRTRFETEFVRGGWDRVFTPEEWGMGADSTPLEEVMAGQDEPKLSYLLDFYSRLPKSVKIVAAASVIGVALVGYIGVEVYSSIVAKESAEQERLAAQARAAMQERLAAEAAEKAERDRWLKSDIVDRVWEKTASPGQWASSCAASLDTLTVEVPGWRMRGMACSKSTATVRWDRMESGSISSAYYGLRGIADVAIDDTGDQMAASLRLEGLTERGDQVAWKMPEIKENFLELFQGLNSNITLTAVARPPQLDEEELLARGGPRPRPPQHFAF
ncbi:MAG: type 4b pilus protein PilO2, partial [Pseudomonadota bacterium]